MWPEPRTTKSNFVIHVMHFWHCHGIWCCWPDLIQAGSGLRSTGVKMGGYAVYLKQKYHIFPFDSFSLVSLSLALRSRNRNLNLQLLICKLQIHLWPENLCTQQRLHCVIMQRVSCAVLDWINLTNYICFKFTWQSFLLLLFKALCNT